MEIRVAEQKRLRNSVNSLKSASFCGFSFQSVFMSEMMLAGPAFPHCHSEPEKIIQNSSTHSKDRDNHTEIKRVCLILEKK